jgi:hypothetical protein
MYFVQTTRLFALSLCLLLWGLSSPALAERVALLIGNSNYGSAQMDLRNPVRDVAALEARLSDLGFKVFGALDQGADEMRASLQAFEQAATGAEMAVFFYAGHGVQIGQGNHLIGTDFSGTDVDALARSAITMEEVRSAMVRAAPQIGIVILDACRDNPFAQSGLVAPGLSQAQGAAGLLIAYATDPGNVAYDGAGDNSIFTTSLLEHIATPGLDVRLMFGRVRQDVVLGTGGRQIPWVEESVLGDHAFAQSGDAQALEGEAAEIARWRAIANSADPADFDGFLKDHPSGLFETFARERLIALKRRPDGQRLGSVEALFAGPTRDRTVAALAALGLVADDGADPATLTRALQLYQSQLADPDDLSEGRLIEDATRSSMFLAATTLQQLRTDLVALRSVERTMRIATDALRQIEEISETNDAALPILIEARRDIADIRRARSTIQQRLDQSRSYYDDVLTRSVRFISDEADSDLLVQDNQTRAVTDAERALTENAKMFLRHVSEADANKKGSYQWLADLIPQD